MWDVPGSCVCTSYALGTVTPRKLTARGEARRQELVDLAVTTFARDGFHTTSVGKLVDGLGVGKGVFYWNAPCGDYTSVIPPQPASNPAEPGAYFGAVESQGAELPSGPQPSTTLVGETPLSWSICSVS